jgi:hypothetical protein
MSNLKKLFLSSLSSQLTNEGYGKFRKQLATNECGKVEKRVHVAFVQHGKGDSATYDAILDISVRFHWIEMIIENWKSQTFSEKPVNSATIGIELGQLLNNKQQRYPILSICQLSESVSIAYRDFLLAGNPYLTECIDPQVVIKRFSSERFCDWHQTLSGIAFRLPLLLIATGNSNQIGGCFEIMQARLERSNDFYATHYPMFREFVVSHKGELI